MSSPTLVASSHRLPEPLATLQEVGCILVRAENGIPGFAETDPDGETLAIALSHAGSRLRPVLDALATQPAENLKGRLEELAENEPSMFAELRDVLVCSYLSTPPMWRLLGYGGRVPRPPADGEAEEYLAGGVLEPVLARGPIYQLLEQDGDGFAATGQRRPPHGEEKSDAT